MSAWPGGRDDGYRVNAGSHGLSSFDRPMKSPIDPESLREISRVTLGHYNDNAESFQDGTRDHDVSQNVSA